MTLDPGSRIPGPGSGTLDHGSRTLDPGFQDPASWNPASRTLNPGPWIRDSGPRTLDPRSGTLDPGPEFWIQVPGSWILGPGLKQSIKLFIRPCIFQFRLREVVSLALPPARPPGPCHRAHGPWGSWGHKAHGAHGVHMDPYGPIWIHMDNMNEYRFNINKYH